MSHLNEQISFTQHAFLVAWGQFAQEIGLIKALEAVPLCQKKYQHRPQTKVLEFFVAHLAGCKHLRDISLAAHPVDKDRLSLVPGDKQSGPITAVSAEP